MSVPISDGDVDRSTCPFRSSVYQRSTRTNVTVVELGCELHFAAPRHLDQRHDVWQFTSSQRKLRAGPQSGSGALVSTRATRARPPGRDAVRGGFRAMRRVSARSRPGAHEASADHVTKHHEHLPYQRKPSA